MAKKYNCIKNGLDIINIETKKIRHIKVSSNKIFDINKTLRAFFNYCINFSNPCTLNKIKIPGNADGLEDESELEGENIQAFNESEQKIIIKNCKYINGSDNTFRVMILLGLFTGLRSGELRFLKRIEINYKKPHSMRDTYATNLIIKGANIHTVKELLGHSSINITEKYYVFVFPENKSKTANLLNDFLS